MKKIAYYIYSLIISVTCAVQLNAQSIKAFTDKKNILIGEHIKLTLDADNIDPAKNSIAKWFQLPDSFAHFEIISRLKSDTIITQKKIHYSQAFIITSFDSGSWQIPPLTVSVKSITTGRPIIKSTTAILIEVSAPNVSALKDIHDVTDILPSPDIPDHLLDTNKNYLLIIIVIVIILFAAIVFWIIKKRKKKHITQIKTISDPYKWAMKQLNQLEKTGMSDDASIRSYYDQLYNICRHYFFEAFSKPVFFYTTKEWEPLIRALPIEHSTGNDFYSLLLMIDRIRFSSEITTGKKRQPEMTEAAKKMITNLAKTKQHNKPAT